MTTLRFDVAGIPKPKGSLRFLGKGRVIEQVDNGAWKTAVTVGAAVARDENVWATVIGMPVTVRLVFTIPRVPSARRRQWPITRSSGDVDKLSRLVLDCITDAHLIGDDSQVIHLTAGKQYGDEPGVTIIVTVD